MYPGATIPINTVPAQARLVGIHTASFTLCGRTVVAFLLCCLLLCTSLLAMAAPGFSGSQTSESGGNRTSFSVGYDQLGLAIGDVVVVSVTTDYSKSGAHIIQGVGHPGGTTVYNADNTSVGQPRLRVDVLVFDGTWPSTLDDQGAWSGVVGRHRHHHHITNRQTQLVIAHRKGRLVTT